ncbi:MAG: DUF4147 domain-containing protein [Patescibacteria group bacterium]|nr:DUF4147 domain-containing protein [Patescibacteria group bacterium]
MERIEIKDSYKIFKAAVEAMDAYNATKLKLRRSGNILRIESQELDLRNYDTIYVVGAGRLAGQMAKAVENMLADRNLSGKIIVPADETEPSLSRITQIESSFPVQDENAVLGTRKILNFLEKSGQNDLIFALFSEGASELLSAPAQGIFLTEKIALTKELAKAGATEKEINIVRKHLSVVKGGRFAAYAYPSKVISMIIPDVPNEDLEMAVCGPTTADTTTYYDCIQILKKYLLYDDLSPSIKNHILKGMKGENFDAPKKGDRVYHNIRNIIVTDLKTGLEKAQEEAEYLEYRPYVLTESDLEIRKTIKNLLEIIRTKEIKKLPISKPACILAGGKIFKNGSRRRDTKNLELALKLSLEFSDYIGQNLEFLSASTECRENQGVIIDQLMFPKILKKGNVLRSDSLVQFFQENGCLLPSFRVRTNINDLIVLLIK